MKCILTDRMEVAFYNVIDHRCDKAEKLGFSKEETCKNITNYTEKFIANHDMSECKKKELRKFTENIVSILTKDKKRESKWVFQGIIDCKKSTLYAQENADKTFDERIALYNAELRKKVLPYIYVRYILNSFDIYVDVEMIRVTAQNVYPELSAEQIYKWIMLHKSPHHVLTA